MRTDEYSQVIMVIMVNPHSLFTILHSLFQQNHLLRLREFSHLQADKIHPAG